MLEMATTVVETPCSGLRCGNLGLVLGSASAGAQIEAAVGDVNDGSEEDEVLAPAELDSESVYGSTAQFAAGRETGGASLQHERLEEAEDLYGTVEKAMPPLFH